MKTINFRKNRFLQPFLLVSYKYRSGGDDDDDDEVVCGRQKKSTLLV